MNDGNRARHASPLQRVIRVRPDKWVYAFVSKIECRMTGPCRGAPTCALVNYGTPVNGNTPGTGTDDINPGTGMDDGNRARHASPLQGPSIIAAIVGATHASPW